MKVCKRCGRALHQEMFRDASTFRRTTYCSRACWQVARRTSRVETEDGEARIILGCGAVVLISPEDATWAAEHSWWLDSNGYVSSKAGRLHRLLLGSPAGLEVDHIHGNKLDARREQLRAVTPLINNRNRSGARRDSTTGVRGVMVDRAGKFVAEIRVDRKKVCLGQFKTIAEAKAARARAEAELWGDAR